MQKKAQTPTNTLLKPFFKDPDPLTPKIAKQCMIIVLPIMIRRGWGFEVSLVVGVIATIAAYALGVWSTQAIGGLN